MSERKRTAAKSTKPLPARLSPTPRGVERDKPKALSTVRKRAPLAPTLEFDRTGYVRNLIRDIPDFPQPGILFRDITPLLSDPRAFTSFSTRSPSASWARTSTRWWASSRAASSSEGRSRRV
jgi:hypothetical protein